MTIRHPKVAENFTAMTVRCYEVSSAHDAEKEYKERAKIRVEGIPISHLSNALTTTYYTSLAQCLDPPKPLEVVTPASKMSSTTSSRLTTISSPLMERRMAVFITG